MRLIKDNEKGKVFQADGFKVFYRVKGSVSGNQAINPYENITLVHGSAEVTIRDRTTTIEAPASFEIPEKTYHKIVALTDIIFIL